MINYGQHIEDSFKKAQQDYDKQLPPDWHEDLELEDRRANYEEDKQEQQMLDRQFDDQQSNSSRP